MFAYRLDGLLAKRTLPSAETLTYGFDSVKRPISISLTGGRSFGQAYDRTGSVTSESRTLDGAITGVNGSGTATYTYDKLGRLIGETGLGANRAYGYDLDGNRTTTTEAGVTRTTRFDRTDQPIDQSQASVWTTAFLSNNYGDLKIAPTVSGGTSTYAYDTAGRTKTIATAGSTASLLPDALGRVRNRTVAGVTDTYGYIGASETVVAVDGATDRLSVTAPDDSRVATKDGSTTAFILADLHGNVAGAMASGSSTIVSAIRYDAYGKTLATAYMGTGSVSLDQRYQGRLDLAPAGGDALYEFSARDYAPNLGIFTSLDSVLGSAAAPRSLNRFLYALANPATLIDPTGHFVSEYDSTPKTRCTHSGDSGCGRTAATSRSKVRAATHRPVQKSTYHGNGHGATWRDSGDEKHTPWAPPSLDAWMNFSDDARASYSAEHWDEAFAWEGWGNNRETVLAYWIVQAGTDDQAALEPLEAIVDIDKISDVQSVVGSHRNRGDMWSDSVALVGIGSVAGVTAKGKVPNPYGRLGDPTTRARAAEVMQDLKDRGFDRIETEVRFRPGDGGSGINRYADVVGKNTATGQSEIVQIGILTKGGVPVVRERRAMDDIIRSPDWEKYANGNGNLTYVDKFRGEE
jgi:RHS repeat-associated protein